jgi:hypothetical protein
MRVDLSVKGLRRRVKRRVAVFFGKKNCVPASRQRSTCHRMPPARLETCRRRRTAVPRAKLVSAS